MRLFIHCTPLTQIDDIHYVTGWSVKTLTLSSFRAKREVEWPNKPFFTGPPTFPNTLDLSLHTPTLSLVWIIPVLTPLNFFISTTLNKIPMKIVSQEIEINRWNIAFVLTFTWVLCEMGNIIAERDMISLAFFFLHGPHKHYNTCTLKLHCPSIYRKPDIPSK